MQNYEAISKEIHKDMRWKPSTDFKFATDDSLCPLVALEANKAVLHLPIAFSKMGEHIALFAVLGLGVGKNYVVDNTGNWLSGYIPALYRGHPFGLSTSDDNQKILCIETESLSKSEGEVFFDEKGGPTERIKYILDFLSQVAANRQATHDLCALFEEMGLLEPWPITIKRDGEDVAAEGLIRVNEVKFNALGKEELLTLREKGALPLIFCQLLSMQNLARIVELEQPTTTSSLPEVLPFDFANDQGNISFEGL